MDKCHRAGLLVGMHVWCSKVSKWDAYVTPHPDARLYKDRVATLAEDVTRLQRTIRTVESLTDWPGEEQCLREGVDRSIYRYAIIGDEIIHYGGLLPDSKGLRLCERGACGTIPREHRAGDKLYHIGIDPSIRMFMVDLDTDILDEIADRVAHVFNYCGFDMVYFDGVEDVPYPFWHYVAKFQMAVWRRFKRKPIVCQGTFYVHYTWHIFSRCGTIDYMAVNPKRDLRKRALSNMLRMKANLMPAEIGWFPWRSPSGNRAGTQVDDIELLCSKATAWDCAFSVVGKVLEHANNDELLDVMGTWERLRLSGYFSEKLKRAMKPFDKRHTLLRLNNRWRILEQHPIEKPAGRDDVRAYLIDSGDGTLAAYWHTWGKGTITIRLTGEEFKLTDFKGNAVEFKRDGDMLILPLGKRYILHCGRLPRDQIATAFQKAVVEFGPGVAIWLQAEDAYKLVGGMVKGSQIGLRDDGAFGDFIVSRIPATPRAIPECYAEYRIRVPHAGAYYIWGRFKYPSGGGQSFAFILAGEPATGALSKAIGNSAVKALQWHWDSQSSGDAIPPGSGRRMVRFKKGINTFRIYAREASDDPKRNPRLDMILITDNAIYVPKDADAMQRVN
ncbi:MAG TPA: hypothetical protein EYP10_10315 [Armatimonadetes bacterium]|nr:hypothetical protein [Armatimonadota bacterium]